MLVKRVRVLSTDEAADFLHCSPRTLKDKRRKGYKGPAGPVYRKQANGRVVYREDDLEQHRDGDARISSSQPYKPTEAANSTT